MTTADIPQGSYIPVGDYQMHVIDLGEGEPIFFLHGGGPGGDVWTDFGPVLPYFTDMRCVLPDLLQYGKSSLPHHNEPMWSFQAKYLDLLMTAMGIESAHFVCSSVGGTAALALAIEYPSRVKKIVFTGSAPTFENPTRVPGSTSPGLAWLARYYADEGPTWQKARDLMADLEWWDRDAIPDETVNIRFAQSSRPEWLELMSTPNARGARQDLTEGLKTLQHEVLIMVAKYDPMFEPGYGVYLLGIIPNSEMYVMDHTRHHLEEERPADYSRIVRAFLEQVT
ncbi:MAG: alpha/beta fold hydrolase [Dehalococcoidia bacterium]